MNEFKTYHPIVNFIYFAFVIGFSCVFMHPICLVISLLSGFAYSVLLKGRKAIKTNLIYMLPTLTFAAFINPAFNHEGITIISYLPSGNPLTFESVVYGLAAAMMIVSVICWFSCYNEIMTSDKFIYLFGKIIPALSLVLSMTLRFVPRFIRQMKLSFNAQKISGVKKSKLKTAVSVFSSVITWSLESAVDTSDSMRARGYGISGRTAFSIFKFDTRDGLALISILALSVYIIAGHILDATYFNFYPMILYADVSAYSVSVMVCYALLCFMPIIIELWEVRKWKRLISKI